MCEGEEGGTIELESERGERGRASGGEGFPRTGDGITGRVDS